MVASEELRCYVASPYGFAESTRSWYEKEVLPLVGRYCVAVNPWTQEAKSILSAPAEQRPKLWLDLGERYLDDVASSDLMVAMFDQEPPDNGTVVEATWAAAHNVPIIGYRNDFRASGERDLPYNLMIGAVIRRSGGIEVSSLVELKEELQRRTTV